MLPHDGYHQIPTDRRGFTLLEVLVALVIMATIAILSWRGLDNVLRLSERIQRVDDSTAQWRAVFAQMQADFQKVPLVRLASVLPQSNRQPPLSCDNTGVQLLIADALGQEQAQWAMVRWDWIDQRLYRQSQPVSGSTDNTQTSTENPNSVPKRVEGPVVRGMRIRLWIDGSGWMQTFNYGEPMPTPDNVDPSSGQTLIPALQDTQNNTTSGNTYNGPTGIEIRVWLPDGRMYTRVFRVGTAT